MTNSKTYIPVDIYKTGRTDCTNGGASSGNNYLFVEVKGGSYTLEEIDEVNGVILVACDGLRDKELKTLKPMALVNSTKHVMCGGNFAYSCDGRFSAAYGNSPLSIHDRVE